MTELISAPAVMAALVSAFVTISLFIIKGIFTSLWSKYFLVYKIEVEHCHEQKKKIKEAISKYKMPLLDSAETLNHRLWNFSGNCTKGWHNIDANKILTDQYYLQTFCYRYLAFYAWCLKFERELIYLDVTLSDEKDLTFVKYIKTLQNIFCDASILNNTGYDNEHDVDHFFKDDHISMVEKMFSDTGGVITYSEFKERNEVDYNKVCKYISSIANDKSCNKWNIINCFHFILMAFLSTFGYDYQKTAWIKLYKLRCSEPKNKLIKNLECLLGNSKLENSKEIKKSLSVLKSRLLLSKIHGILKRMLNWLMQKSTSLYTSLFQ